MYFEFFDLVFWAYVVYLVLRSISVRARNCANANSVADAEDSDIPQWMRDDPDYWRVKDQIAADDREYY